LTSVKRITHDSRAEITPTGFTRETSEKTAVSRVLHLLKPWKSGLPGLLHTGFLLFDVSKEISRT
jgi:hypothetical protein